MMNLLPFPDFWHLQSAHGWLLLGNTSEAARDLEKLHPRYQDWPEVAELRCRFLLQRKQWQAALDLAATQILRAPERANNWIHFAYCLHELRQTIEAREILQLAARRFPDDHLIPSNLACYSCHLGRFHDAAKWVKRALRILEKTGSF